MFALTGRAAVEPTPVDRPGLRGRIGGELAFAGSGQSVDALVGGLAGEGRIELRGAAVPRLDPGALARVLARTQGAEAGIDETNVAYALGQEFDRAALPLPDGSVPATLSAGVVRVGPLTIGAATTANASYDLRAQTLAMDVVFTAKASGKFWSGPPPSVDVSLTGGPDAPARRVDAAPLAAGLAAQAIARETDRISALEADIRERAYFNRRLKAEKFMRQREAELAAYAAEQARLKAEDDRRRAADDAARAEEARRRAADDAARAEEARKRAADEAARAAQAQPNPPAADEEPAAPPSTTPPANPPIPAPRPKPEIVDPTANGFY